MRACTDLRITTESSGLVAQPQTLSSAHESTLDRQQHSPQPPAHQQKLHSQQHGRQDYSGSMLRPKYQGTKTENDYLDRSYANTPDRPSNGDSLKSISGIMGNFKFKRIILLVYLRKLSLNAEYDGSPRRFGQAQNTESSLMYSQQSNNTAQSSKMSSNYTAPRPGFPQVSAL